MNFIVEALHNLRPGAIWSLNGDTYDGLDWLDKTQSKPTKKQVEAEIERLQTEYNQQEYQRLRAPEYPDFREYLDGIVKGDADQVQAYINACKAVKLKYPKDL
jgi:hypothetical protein